MLCCFFVVYVVTAWVCILLLPLLFHFTATTKKTKQDNAETIQPLSRAPTSDRLWEARRVRLTPKERNGEESPAGAASQTNHKKSEQMSDRRLPFRRSFYCKICVGNLGEHVDYRCLAPTKGLSSRAKHHNGSPAKARTVMILWTVTDLYGDPLQFGTVKPEPAWNEKANPIPAASK